MTYIDSMTNRIYITRGDDLDLDLKISIGDSVYTFNIGDKIKFGIYNARGMNQDAVLLKEFIVSEESDIYHIHIESENMKIGNLINRPKDYWYEVVLNETNTVIGYGKNEPTIITLLPEGSDIKGSISGGEMV